MNAEEFGSREAGRKGGKAAASKMTPKQRAERARQAARTRWEKAGKEPLKRATHSGIMEIGSAKIECAVLEDGTRLLSRASFVRAIGRRGKVKGGEGYRGESNTPVFLAADNLKPFLSKDLIGNSYEVPFVNPKGQTSIGYRAALLPEVCYVFIDADEAGALKANQQHIAEKCRILVRGFATVGIVALVDEATGYQRDRARDELAKILQAYVAKELQKWLPTFPLEFYELVCQVRGEPITRAYKRPAYFGHLTNNLVYARLAPGVLQELRKKNPTKDSGLRKHRHFQFLTPDMGHPKLKEHLEGVKTALKIAHKTGVDWDGFLELLDDTHPKYQPLPLFDGADYDSEE